MSSPDEDEGRRSIAASLGWIGQEYPELKPAVTLRLLQWLSRYDVENIDSNSEIICVLLDFKAAEAKEVIGTDLSAGCVDERLCGDWNEIQEELDKMQS